MKLSSYLFSLILAGAINLTKCSDTAEDTLTRDLRRNGGGGNFGKNRPNKGEGFNSTAYLAEKCDSAGVVCGEVKADDLADCANVTSFVGDGDGHHHFGGKENSSDSGNSTSSDDSNSTRALVVQNEEDRELFEFLEGYDLITTNDEEDYAFEPREDLKRRELGGRKRPHSGGGWGGGKGGESGTSFSKGSSSKFAGLNETEIEAIKMKRLVCKCCAE